MRVGGASAGPTIMVATVLTVVAGVVISAGLSREQHRAPTAAPMAVGMAGECPIFHAWSRDGSETFTLICAPGAQLGPLQLKGQAR